MPGAASATPTARTTVVRLDGINLAALASAYVTVTTAQPGTPSQASTRRESLRSDRNARVEVAHGLEHGRGHNGRRP